MSLIYNTTLDVYVLWTRWGAFGEEGMHQKTPYLTKEEAVAEFKSIFRSKTGNHWEDRNEFVRKPGRFELIHAKPPRKPVILKNFNFLDTAAKSKVAPAINEAMQVICNFGLLNEGFRNLQIDIPAGQIPQQSIDRAFEILQEIEKTCEIYEAVKMRKLDTLSEEDKQKSKRGKYILMHTLFMPNAQTYTAFFSSRTCTQACDIEYQVLSHTAKKQRQGERNNSSEQHFGNRTGKGPSQ